MAAPYTCHPRPRSSQAVISPTHTPDKARRRPTFLGRRAEDRCGGGASVRAPSVTENSAWVDDGTEVTRSELQMKLSFATAQFGLARAGVCGIWTEPILDQYTRTVVASASIGERKPLPRQGSDDPELTEVPRMMQVLRGDVGRNAVDVHRSRYLHSHNLE
jgi:hypothetical protein